MFKFALIAAFMLSLGTLAVAASGLPVEPTTTITVDLGL